MPGKQPLQKAKVQVAGQGKPLASILEPMQNVEAIPSATKGPCLHISAIQNALVRIKRACAILHCVLDLHLQHARCTASTQPHYGMLNDANLCLILMQ